MKGERGEDLRGDLREAYDRNAALRNVGELALWKLEERRRFFELLRTREAHSLLEIGSGPGMTAAWFRDQGLAVTCVDLSPENVRLCQDKGLASSVMDVTSLEFSDASFDAVYTMNCLLHLPKPELPYALQEIHRILRPSGLAYVGVYGGRDSEGIWEGDEYEPKRFFSFHTDDAILAAVHPWFEVALFKRIECMSGVDLHFQSMILKPAGTIGSDRPIR